MNIFKLHLNKLVMLFGLTLFAHAICSDEQILVSSNFLECDDVEKANAIYLPAYPGHQELVASPESYKIRVFLERYSRTAREFKGMIGSMSCGDESARNDELFAHAQNELTQIVDQIEKLRWDKDQTPDVVHSPIDLAFQLGSSFSTANNLFDVLLSPSPEWTEADKKLLLINAITQCARVAQDAAALAHSLPFHQERIIAVRRVMPMDTEKKRIKFNGHYDTYYKKFLEAVQQNLDEHYSCILNSLIFNLKIDSSSTAKHNNSLKFKLEPAKAVGRLFVPTRYMVLAQQIACIQEELQNSIKSGKISIYRHGLDTSSEEYLRKSLANAFGVVRGKQEISDKAALVFGARCKAFYEEVFALRSMLDQVIKKSASSESRLRIVRTILLMQLPVGHKIYTEEELPLSDGFLSNALKGSAYFEDDEFSTHHLSLEETHYPLSAELLNDAELAVQDPTQNSIDTAFYHLLRHESLSGIAPDLETMANYAEDQFSRLASLQFYKLNNKTAHIDMKHLLAIGEFYKYLDSLKLSIIDKSTIDQEHIKGLSYQALKRQIRKNGRLDQSAEIREVTSVLFSILTDIAKDVQPIKSADCSQAILMRGLEGTIRALVGINKTLEETKCMLSTSHQSQMQIVALFLVVQILKAVSAIEVTLYELAEQTIDQKTAQQRFNEIHSAVMVYLGWVKEVLSKQR